MSDRLRVGHGDVLADAQIEQDAMLGLTRIVPRRRTMSTALDGTLTFCWRFSYDYKSML
jgi:hypothetical protein